MCIVRNLCERFGCIALVPFRYTEPEGIEGAPIFVNALAVVSADRLCGSVKRILNNIETSMGRDRKDPLRSVKSRTADIDIVAEHAHFDLTVFKDMSETYVQACITGQGKQPDLRALGLASHQGPASVYLDAITGDIVVIEDEFDCFINGFKATFGRE